jgi:hypothetical protein
MEVLLFPSEVESHFEPSCPFYGCAEVTTCDRFVFVCNIDRG